MTYIFIDTNILLHFQIFDQIPWQQIVGKEVQLVVPPVVVAELDKHKRHKNSKIASRAKAILKKVEDIAGGNISYPLLYLHSRPKESTLKEYHLDRMEQDDLLLASILDFKTLYPADEVKLVSNDTGPRLRARNLQIDAFQLDEKYLLPLERSEEEKLIDQLKQENIKLKNRIPKLNVTFTNGALVAELQKPPEVITKEEFVEEEYPKGTGHLYPLTYLDPDDFKDIDSSDRLTSAFHLSMKMAAMNPLRPTEYQISRYNEELISYQDKYKAYLAEKYHAICVLGHSLKLEICLHNTGSAPAEDIDLEFDFPTNVKVMTEAEIPRPPEKPKEPKIPKSRLDLHITSPAFTSTVYRTDELNSPNPAEAFGVTITVQENGSQANFYTRNLKQHQTEHIDALYISFPSLSEMKSFTFGYTLIVANIPDPIRGRLHVKIREHEEEDTISE